MNVHARALTVVRLPASDPTAVVDFWRAAGADRWFAKDPAFDRQFRDLFLASHEAAARGECGHWRATAIAMGVTVAGSAAQEKDRTGVAGGVTFATPRGQAMASASREACDLASVARAHAGLVREDAGEGDRQLRPRLPI